MTKEKSRNFIFLLYPESMPTDWEMRLESVGMPMAVSPLHDKDLSEIPYDEMPESDKKIIDSGGKVYKKAHYHVIYVANNPVTTDSVRHKIRKVLGDKSVAHVKIPVNIANYYLYLTHESKDAIQKKKQRYAKADIKLLNNFDIERYVTLSVEDKKDKLHLAIDLIRNYGCMNVIDLSFLIEKNPEFGLTRRELDDLTTQYASSLRLWFDGNYQISKRGGDLDNTLSEDFEDIGESVIAESDSGPEMTNENYKQLIAEKKAKHEAEMKALKETAKHSPRA